MNLESTPTVRPPVFLGCFFAAAALVILFLMGAFAVKFLESGANNGKVRLEVPDAYAIGSVEFIGSENFFIVRLRDASFVALSDLDAANRANQARRCRVGLASIDDPSLGIASATLANRMTAGANGVRAVLRETCYGSVYDLTGATLGSDGPNLDRYPVSVAPDGHLVVDTSRRICSRREASNAYVEVACS